MEQPVIINKRENPYSPPRAEQVIIKCESSFMSEKDDTGGKGSDWIWDD